MCFESGSRRFVSRWGWSGPDEQKLGWRSLSFQGSSRSSSGAEFNKDDSKGTGLHEP
jgi:hypothetical protein